MKNIEADFQKNVREYYDSFVAEFSEASKLTFYKDILKNHPNIKIPESLSRLTFGCCNPLSHLIYEIEEREEDFMKPYVILDAGGGSGFDSFLVRQLFPNALIFNFDLSLNLLKLGVREFSVHLGEKINSGGCRTLFICANACGIPFKAGLKFDFIISNAVLNLIADKASVLNRLADMLKPDGTFFLADIAFCGDGVPPAGFYNKGIKDGLFYAPTIVCEREYSRLIFNEFGYMKNLESHEMKPELIGSGPLDFTISCKAIKKEPPCEIETIPCPCGEKPIVKVYQNVNVEESPLYLKMILENSLNSSICAKCGRSYQDFIPYFFEWPEKSIAAHVFPASLKAQEMMVKAQLGMLDRVSKEMLFFGYCEFRDYLFKKIF